MTMCRSRGFAGPPCCILEEGHGGDHQYGNEAEIEAKQIRKDAERYRWIRQNTAWTGYGFEVIPDEFDSAVDSAMNEQAPTRKGVKYGCHVELEPGQEPDSCVIDSGDIEDCIHAERLTKQGKGRNDCEYWRPIMMKGKKNDTTT